MIRNIVLIMSVILTGCGSAGVAGAIHKTSVRVERSLDAGFEEVYSKPVVLNVRLNPCACGDELEFEADIYGTWRHVMIRGSEDAMTRLKNEAASHGNGVSFESLFLFNKSLYQARSGQQFYMLDAVLSSDGG